MTAPIYMIWQCPAFPRLTLGDHVRVAAAYYQRKYHARAAVIWAHPADVAAAQGDSGRVVVDGVPVRPVATVQRGNIWMGAGEAVTP